MTIKNISTGVGGCLGIRKHSAEPNKATKTTIA